MENYYEILEVSEDATISEIESAIRKKLKLTHPDLAEIHGMSKEESTRKTQELLEIKEILTDEVKRKIYNEQLYEYFGKDKKEKSSLTDRIMDKAFDLFIDFLKDYQKIKNEERKNSLEKRILKVKTYFIKNYNPKIFDLKSKIIVNLKHIKLQISEEFLYQISKFKIKKGDTTQKYVLRIRKMVAIPLSVFILAEGIGYGMDKYENIKPIPEDKTAKSEQSRNDHYIYYTYITRNYTVQYGDTLSQLAEDAGVSIQEIKDMNDNINGTTIYYKDVIKIPYKISNEDLDYYTEIINVEDITLDEICEKYDTTAKSIKNINDEAMEELSDGSYAILSKTLKVPKFITQKELQEQKEIEREYFY